jgi:hypothetical protein
MSNKAKPLPMDIIREALEIDPTSKTGLRWKWRPRHHFATRHGWNSVNQRNAGKDAGCFAANEGRVYYGVRIGSFRYKAHRIVFALSRGFDPLGMDVDHIDGNGGNNAISNLRIATRAENARNSGIYANNKSGVRGVFWDHQAQKWRSRIKVNGREIHIGYFRDRKTAQSAYEAAAREAFGQFYRETTTP